ncbi:MAG TPA: hypothetical protein DDW94_01235 [Deltaproteobacteria bacterium]|nr:MAG: hypothetical protein A2Z79_06605 [Deltaproteobacteria bacterium GWA2_55_82]OGQ63314.1 MAG: hypothetical protein A3I81_00995 [Deltaproteobacteria bacterium RIFCSPLOWO2_02_FULL_55_12]OIJ73150.1 MAG: hypothetical protein A2V21_302060 [Deltaproteobacteria bacterium GWC2_55_46]HBG45595.1 hypothetical protein [Deltaproteobacteria bacterium]HCY10426.1 hypothetical protein [Deltaproteobacteria bacterium]
MRLKEIRQEVKGVGIGFLLGVLCLLFGVSWAVYITVNHDSIHRQLSESARAALEEKFVISGAGHQSHQGHVGHQMDASSEDAQAHMAGAEGEVHSGHEDAAHGHLSGSRDGAGAGMEKELFEIRKEISERVAQEAGHHGPEMEEAHERLARGHLHAMGLGVLTISVSMMLAFVPAGARTKTLAAAALGTGSFFYPLAWIIMGFRTTALGEAAAEASVLPMAVFSTALVSAGLLIAFVCLLKWLLKGD